MRISDWSSDVCSSDLRCRRPGRRLPGPQAYGRGPALPAGELPRHRRRHGPMGLPLPSALSHGGRHVPGGGGRMIRIIPSRGIALGVALFLAPAITAPALAQDALPPSPAATPAQTATPDPNSPSAQGSQEHAGMDMPGMDMTDTKASGNGATMDMGSMQGGKAPPDARNSDDYADGYRNSTLPGYETIGRASCRERVCP